MYLFIINKLFFPSYQSENESFVLKDLNVLFISHFMHGLFVSIYHIHIAVPWLFILSESEIVLYLEGK